MKNIKLTIEYDGTEYCGWQRQQNGLSIQQVIEEGLERITGDQITITGSGRTDSGVHARGQVANFFTNASIPAERFSYALNSVLPRDIRIVDSEEVSPDFHARYSAKGKRYRYAILLNPHGTAIGHRYYYHIRQSLDVDKMAQACRDLIGTYDFKAFQAYGSSVKTTERTIYTAEFDTKMPYVNFIIEGNGFLYNMVRIIVGTLIEIGAGKKEPEDMKKIILSKDRNFAGPTAPPQGLFLDKVFY